MSKQAKKTNRGLHLLGLALLGGLLAACTSNAGNTSGETSVSQVTNAPSGAEIWANNCARCHNFRDPTTLSDSQWDVAMMHMRVRAKLNGADARAVLKFLQASN